MDNFDYEYGYDNDEFEYLKWFFVNCDFGPAHEDVVDIMQNTYKKETGKEVPKAYKIGVDDDE